jgi:hypothetical protein
MGPAKRRYTRRPADLTIVSHREPSAERRARQITASSPPARRPVRQAETTLISTVPGATAHLFSLIFVREVEAARRERACQLRWEMMSEEPNGLVRCRS